MKKISETGPSMARRQERRHGVHSAEPSLATVEITSHIQAQGEIVDILSDGRVVVDLGEKVAIGHPIRRTRCGLRGQQ